MALWIQVRIQSVTPPHATWGKQIGSLLLYLSAIPVAFYRPMLSLALIALVGVIWLLPPRIESSSEGKAAGLRGPAVNSSARRR
jgi:hypothetical protein